MRFTASRRKSEKWLLNYARNANNPIPVGCRVCDYDEKPECAEMITVNEVARPGNEPSKDKKD
jgi:hypothetical protein